MQQKLHIMQIFAIFALSVSFNASADSWNCSNSDLVREVVIEYPEGGSVPCNVIYKKQTEAVEDQVLWSAESEEGYCEEKATELVANLESWGWVCLETVSPETDAGAEAEAGSEAEVSSGVEAGSEAEASPEAEAGSEASPDVQY